MDRVVIDTNIFISAMMNAEGAPRAVLRLALNRDIIPVFGNALFSEYEAVLSRADLFEAAPASRSERDDVFDALRTRHNIDLTGFNSSMTQRGNMYRSYVLMGRA